VRMAEFENGGDYPPSMLNTKNKAMNLVQSLTPEQVELVHLIRQGKIDFIGDVLREKTSNLFNRCVFELLF